MPDPILVVGASRSGTALLRSSLNQHPDVHIAGETHYFDDLRPRLDAPHDAPVQGAVRDEIVSYFRALSHRPYGHGGEPDDGWLGAADLITLAGHLGGTADAYFTAYCQLEARHDHGASTPRWGEKTPRHVFRLDDVLHAFPRAQVVCMIRDPRAVVASYRDWRNRGGFDLEADPGHAEALAEEHERTRASYDPVIATLLWRATVRRAAAARRRFGPDRVRAVRYEDLTTRPDRTLVDLCAWLGLEFEDSMRAVPVHNSSVEPFDPSGGFRREAVDRWRDRLGPSEIATVQLVAGRSLERCGYEPAEVPFQALRAVPSLLATPAAVVRASRANLDRTDDPVDYVTRRVRALF